MGRRLTPFAAIKTRPLDLYMYYPQTSLLGCRHVGLKYSAGNLLHTCLGQTGRTCFHRWTGIKPILQLTAVPTGFVCAWLSRQRLSACPEAAYSELQAPATHGCWAGNNFALFAPLTQELRRCQLDMRVRPALTMTPVPLTSSQASDCLAYRAVGA